MARREQALLDFRAKLEEQALKLEKLEEKFLKLEFEQKEFRDLSDRCLATLEHRDHILCRLNEIKRGLREKIRLLTLSLNSTFKQAVEVEVESRLRQMKELTTVRAVAEIQDRVARNPNYEIVLNNMERMEIELRCGICAELMVSATTLNCMHTFCLYCISQWKIFEGTRQAVARCPVCRDPTVSEKRNYFADNLIGIMVDGYPEAEKNSRKELVAHHRELTRNVEVPPETNLTTQSSIRFCQFIGEIEKEMEDFFKFLAEPMSPLPVVPPPQPTHPARLPVAAVIPVQRMSGPRTSEAGRNRLNQQRVRGSADSDRQTRSAILGILGPRAIQRAANRTNQTSSRLASGRKVQGSLSRPHWRY